MKKRTGCDISIIHTAPRTAITSGVHPVLNAPTYGVPTGSSGYCSHSPEFNSYEVILDMDQNCLKRSAPLASDYPMETSSRLMASNGVVNHRVVITGESLVPTVTDQVLGKKIILHLLKQVSGAADQWSPRLLAARSSLIG